VLAKLVRAGTLTQAAAYEAENEPLPRRAPFPALAWHAAGELARNAPQSQASVVSTLDADLQSRLEPMAAAVAGAQGPDATAAILVVEIKSRAVRAAVGSAGRDRAGGWVDMTRALRSPGSALKPFIYAMAMDDGLVAADTQLADNATRFADYQPENFDRVFHDKVTVREALAHSLNVPAVATLEKLGPEAFAGRIEAAGAHLARPKAQLKEAGLALALGGEGITWRDLVMLYAALGDGGIAKPLAWTEDDAKARERSGGTRLVRPESARQILDILREAPAPRGRAPSALTRGGPSMAFKTGTSYGFRDAVAAGVVGGYAILVWTGRADGGARGGLTGRDAALPLLFDVADATGAATSAPRPIAPKAAPLGLQTLRAAECRPAPDLPARRRGGAGRRPGREGARPGPGRRRRGPDLVRGRPAAGPRPGQRPRDLAAGGAGLLQAVSSRRARAPGDSEGADPGRLAPRQADQPLIVLDIGDPDVEVVHQAVGQRIDPAVHGQRLAARPGVLDEDVGGDVAHLAGDVQLGQAIQHGALSGIASSSCLCSAWTSRIGCSQWSTRPRRWPSMAAATPPQP
jgi:membrane peptidoglycan carboxypeptidase